MQIRSTQHETISGHSTDIKEQMKQKLNQGNQAAKIRDSLVVSFSWFCIQQLQTNRKRGRPKNVQPVDRRYAKIEPSKMKFCD
jgi:hypothetical protein